MLLLLFSLRSRSATLLENNGFVYVIHYRYFLLRDTLYFLFSLDYIHCVLLFQGTVRLYERRTCW